MHSKFRRACLTELIGTSIPMKYIALKSLGVILMSDRSIQQALRIQRCLAEKRMKVYISVYYTLTPEAN